MHGTLSTGEGMGSGFVTTVQSLLTAELTFRPYPGTLNLSGIPDDLEVPTRTIPDVGDDYCDGVLLHPCWVGGLTGAVIRPLVPDYPADKTEVLAPVRVRRLFDLTDGDRVPLAPPASVPENDELLADPVELDSFDAVVFDLDNTLVRLAVDWDAVFADIEALLNPVLDGGVHDHSRNALFDAARNHGRYDELDDILARAELDGTADATPLPLVEWVTRLDCPVGVCTANAVEAARDSLDRFGALGGVDAIVGRETVPHQKPRPEPLARCLDELGVGAGNALFVGDHASDAETAQRAGTSYLHPENVAAT